MAEIKHSFCRICESLCGLEIEVENNQIQNIRPDQNHLTTRGFACPKGLKQHKMYNTADRLKYPMQKIDGQWKRVSWGDANSHIGAKLRQLKKDHGPNSVAMYVGTAAGFGALHPMFAQGFMTGLGSNNMYSSATQDCANKFAVAQHMYGFPFTQPFPDLFNSKCLIIVGANPVVSKWSFLQVPNPTAHLKEMEKRGAKIWVIDPRKTETAKVAGKHVFIKPGSDIYFYLSFLNELEKSNGIDQQRVHEHMEGLDDALKLASQWPAEKTQKITGIDPDILREMVGDYIEAQASSFYSSTGVNMGGQGSLAFWIQEVINAASGNLDRKGGTLVSRGVVDFPKFGAKNGVLLREDRSRIGNFPSVNDAFPGGLLADEILQDGPGKIRALFVTGGNPLITMANSERLKKAFEELELLVCLDIQPSESAVCGHFMLPCTSPLERPDLPFVFPLLLGLQAKPYLQATKSVIEPEFEQRDEATIYVDLCKAAGINLFDSAIAQRFMQTAKSWAGKKTPGGQKLMPQEFILSLLLRVTGQGSFKKLLKEKHGRLQPEHEPGSFLSKRVFTENKKVQLSPAILIERAQQLELDFERQLADNRFRLITKRAVTTHNSWTHNIDEFVQGPRNSNYLYMHPEDLEAMSLKKLQLVDVSSETGMVRLPVYPLEDLQKGTVALPHGWGHQHSGLSTAKKTKGVNVNILAADGPNGIDPVSGMVKLTSIGVEIKAAEQEQALSWSGT
jgi:formate dehydrogenase